MYFTIDLFAFVLLLLVLITAFLIYASLPYPLPRIRFSKVKSLEIQTYKLKWKHFPIRLYQASFALLALAFIDPHFIQPLNEKKKPLEIPKEGMAIYLLLDRSGSMNEEIGATTKMDLLKKMTSQFIQERPQDLIGLVAFARVPQVLSPLTLDQEALLDQLDAIQTAEDPEENGTAIGYAIYKTAKLIAATRHFAKELQGMGKPAYEIKNSMMVVITDGFQDPSRLDYGNRLRTIELDEAASYAKEEGIRLYIINLDPKFALADFAPHRKQMKAVAESTGGKLYLISQGKDLQEVFHSIDQLEKITLPPQLSAAPLQKNQRTLSLFPFLIVIGGAFYAAGLLLETTWLRRFP